MPKFHFDCSIKMNFFTDAETKKKLEEMCKLKKATMSSVVRTYVLEGIRRDEFRYNC